LLGDVLLDQDRPDEAEPILRSLHEQYPKWGLATCHLARCAKQQGRQKESGGLAMRAIRQLGRRRLWELGQMLILLIQLPGYQSETKSELKRILRWSLLPRRIPSATRSLLLLMLGVLEEQDRYPTAEKHLSDAKRLWKEDKDHPGTFEEALFEFRGAVARAAASEGA
jgi:tetratricopeptide (TPR) repeat protein